MEVAVRLRRTSRMGMDRVDDWTCICMFVGSIEARTADVAGLGNVVRMRQVVRGVRGRARRCQKEWNLGIGGTSSVLFEGEPKCSQRSAL